VIDLVQSGKVLSRNVWLFDRVRNLDLPSPSIQAELTGNNGNYTLHLQSAVLARHVYVTFGDHEVKASDNYIDLLPNEPVTLQVKAKSDIDELRRALKVRNITDAFTVEAK